MFELILAFPGVFRQADEPETFDIDNVDEHAQLSFLCGL